MGFGVRGQGRLGVGVWCQGSGEGRLGVGVLGQALRHAGVAEAFCRAFCQAGLAPFMAPAAMQLAGIPCVHLMHEQARPGPAACMHGAAGVSPPCWAPVRRVYACMVRQACPLPAGPPPVACVPPGHPKRRPAPVDVRACRPACLTGGRCRGQSGCHPCRHGTACRELHLTPRFSHLGMVAR